MSNEMEQKVRPIWESSNRLIDTRRRRRARWLKHHRDLLLVAPTLSKVMLRDTLEMASPDNLCDSSSSSPADQSREGAALVIARAVSSDSSHSPQHKEQ